MTIDEVLEKGKKIGYNKGIDDFIEKVELKYLGVHPDELYDKYYPREICKQIKEIAEQLKVGGKNVDWWNYGKNYWKQK